jgi:hypothetical protein
MRLECGVGFRQLRTCRRTRPGQLSYVPQAESPKETTTPNRKANIYHCHSINAIDRKSERIVPAHCACGPDLQRMVAGGLDLAEFSFQASRPVKTRATGNLHRKLHHRHRVLGDELFADHHLIDRLR